MARPGVTAGFLYSPCHGLAWVLMVFRLPWSVKVKTDHRLDHVGKVYGERVRLGFMLSSCWLAGAIYLCTILSCLLFCP